MVSHTLANILALISLACAGHRARSIEGRLSSDSADGAVGSRGSRLTHHTTVHQISPIPRSDESIGVREPSKAFAIHLLAFTSLSRFWRSIAHGDSLARGPSLQQAESRGVHRNKISNVKQSDGQISMHNVQSDKLLHAVLSDGTSQLDNARRSKVLMQDSLEELSPKSSSSDSEDAAKTDTFPEDASGSSQNAWQLGVIALAPFLATLGIVSSGSRKREDSELRSPSAVLNPILALCLVPVAWGTYGPAMKVLYALDAPPPELLFNWMNYIVSALGLLIVSRGWSRSSDAEQQPGDVRKDSSLRAGAELGAYLFAGTTCQIFGLRYTTASRGAFIVQLTTIIVPLLDSLINRRLPSRRTLGACFLAFVGVVLFTYSAGVDANPTLLGDALVGLSSIAYSLHVVRLSYHAPLHKPVVLAQAKEISRLVFASVVLGGALLVIPGLQHQLLGFASSFVTTPAAAATVILITVWNGIAVTAFPTWAQSYGQSSVKAGTAQVLYSLQPLWSSLFGFAILGERFSTQGLIGASVILVAILLAATDMDTNESELPPTD